MDQQFFNVLIGVVMALMSIIGACVGWWVNNIWDMVKSLQKQVVDLNLDVSRNYVPRQELQATLERILNKLDELQKEMRNHK